MWRVSILSHYNNIFLLINQSRMAQEVIGHFSVGAEIGRGSFANVHKGQDQSTGKAVAIKAVFRSRLKNQKLIDNLEIEINILKNMRNPHIVALLDCIKADQYIYLIMEYCSLGDLSYFIRKREQLQITHPIIRSVLERYPSPKGYNGLNKTLVINFVKQLVSALKFLRSQNLVHRDIKPQNLLLSPPCHTKEEFETKGFAGYWELPVLKIADFGFARFLPSTSMAETLCGSPLYMAPEILRYEKYNAKADLWSVGAVVYEMTVGRPPFRAANHVELLRKIERAKDEISFPSNADIDDRLIRLICSLLKANPTERMGFNEFFNDPLVTDDVETIDKPLDCKVEDDQLFISEYLQVPDDESDAAEQQLPTITQNKGGTGGTRVNIPERVDEEETIDELTTSGSSAKTNTAPKTYMPNTEISEVTTVANPSLTSVPGKVAELLIAHKKQQQQKLQQQPHVLSRQHSQSRRKIETPYEREYVVVDKGTVEVNSLADDISRGPHVARGTGISPRAYTFGTGLTRGYSFNRRKSSVGTNGSSGTSVGSGNALREVLDYTHEKLFGYVGAGNTQGVATNGSFGSSSSNEGVPKRNTSNTILNKLITAKPLRSSEGDIDIIAQLEMLATMAHAISLFAEVKFAQLIPLPPSADRLLDPFTSSNLESLGLNDKLPSSQVREIGAEGVALYMKVLGLLAEAMKLAGEWWKVNSLSSRTNGELNELVQWIRNRFNESFEKTEFLRLKLAESNGDQQQQQQQQQHSVINSVELGNKLIFDRALEMSKGAAMNELKGEDLLGCERSYAKSVWMLEALLHNGLESNNDKLTVQTFVDSIGNRLLVLRGKLSKLNASQT